MKNESFVAKAPQAVVDKEKEKGDMYREMLNKVLDGLAKLK